jgi:hypothetical protein
MITLFIATLVISVLIGALGIWFAFEKTDSSEGAFGVCVLVLCFGVAMIFMLNDMLQHIIKLTIV